MAKSISETGAIERGERTGLRKGECASEKPVLGENAANNVANAAKDGGAALSASASELSVTSETLLSAPEYLNGFRSPQLKVAKQEIAKADFRIFQDSRTDKRRNLITANYQQKTK